MRILILILVLNGLSGISVIIFERKKPEKTIAWLTLILLFPIVGLASYAIFGRNWRSNTAIKNNANFSKYIVSDLQKTPLASEYLPLLNLLSGNSESPVFENNEITIYQDGDVMFSRMKKELMQATHHIHMEYYTLRADGIGNEIKNILIDKAKEGVEVRLIIDCSGSSDLSTSFIEELRKAGTDVILFSCFKTAFLKSLSTHALYRDHRKLTIIDGKLVFIGGNNIGDEYLGKSHYGFWRDTHLLVRGDFVRGVQNVFLSNFIAMKKVHNAPYKLDKATVNYFPSITVHDNKIMQLVRSGPDSLYYSTLQCMLKMISMAAHHIYITVPYFIPPNSIKEAIKMAVIKGVDVTILFPDQLDHMFMHHASKSHLYELTDCGVKIYLYDRNSFIHAKVITVDGKLSTVGSTNMDHYSFEYNYEINAVIYDAGITSKLEKQFLEDLKNSHQMTTNYYNEIPRHTKVFQSFARVLSGIL